MTTATVTTAVFPVAGLGTRFLPATKAMPKELMPIIDRPLIQYAVEEAIAAGITKLVFVTGRTKRAIADHFDAAPELERALEKAGKLELAALVRETLPPHVHAVYIRQRAALGLGHAVLCARPAVGDEPFAVLLADEFITPRAGALSPTAALAAAYAEAGRSQILLQDVPASEAHKYGIAVPGPTPSEIVGLVEKPAPGDAIDALARRGRVGASALDGRRHDCGSPLGYLGAVIATAARHGEYGADFRGLMAAELTSGEWGA